MSKKQNQENIILTALKRFKVTADAEDDYRKQAKQDFEVYEGGGQWDSQVRTDRNSDSRPCLVINKMPGFVRQITNGLRQNMPQILTIPVGDSDEDTAEIFSGIIRHIQEASHANIAYANANQGQTIAGRGYFRLITAYTDNDSFDKEIQIKRIKDPLTVYFDPAAMEPDYSDAMYAFITSDLTKEDFEKQYPNKLPVGNDMLAGRGDDTKAWITKNSDDIRIAEYFSIDEEEIGSLYQLEDGSIVTEINDKSKVMHERPKIQRKVIWRMITAHEILDEKPWPGKYIPIIPVLGEDIDINGKRYLKGMVRDAIDPQRMYNYWASAQTEMIALAPKAPYIVAEGQIEAYKEWWGTANTKNHAYLPYKPTSIAGTVVGAPQRQSIEPPVQAMSMAMAQANEDIKSVTGIYDASLGNRSNEVSGKAINARKMQGDIANYHISDNFAYAMLYNGKQLIDLIPKIYDTPRIVRILGEDGTSEYKKINQPSDDNDENGISKIYDLRVGKYDVVVDVGPSYKTKRQEDSENMTKLLQANPKLWEVAGDIFAKALDFPDAKILAERLKKALPPQLQDATDGQTPIPPEIKNQLDQSKQMVNVLSQQVHTLLDERDKKILEYQQKDKELQSRERIALQNNQKDITLQAMRSEGDTHNDILNAELNSIGTAKKMLDQHTITTTQNQMMANQSIDNNQQNNQSIDMSQNNSKME